MNRNRILLFALVALLCVGPGAFAMTVTWEGTDGGSQLISGSTGGQLPAGCMLVLGNFGTMTDAQIAALGSNPSAMVWPAFQSWATTAIDSDGVFSESTIRGGSASFGGEQAYLVAFNSPSFYTATVAGVFKGPSSNPSVGDPWVFPASDDAPGVRFSLDAITQNGVITGGWGTFNSPKFGGPVNALIVGVPEPSTYMLVGIGLLGVLTLRRRS